MNREKTIAVFGIGRVGSVIVAALLRAGFNVYAVDKDASKLDTIASGEELYPDEPLAGRTLIEGYKEGRLLITSDGGKASKASRIKIISVPIGLKGRNPDFSLLKLAIKELTIGMRKGDLVSIESSVPPGTSRYVVLPILETLTGLEVENDFFLVYSPERIFQGRALKDLEENYPKVVAGAGPRSLEEGVKFYSKVSKRGVLPLSSLEAAEVEKLAEGVYRDVNIALANELALACEALGVDYWEVMKAANSQPFCHLHRPGTGVGGNCIPIYPYFLLSTLKGMDVPVIEHSRKRNESMPRCVAFLFDEFLSQSGHEVSDVLVLGLSFRGNVADDRNSPTYELVRELKGLGYRVRVHDPYLRKPSKKVKFYRDIRKALKGVQAVILSTDHSVYSSLGMKEMEEMAGEKLLVFDARGVLDRTLFDKRRLRILGNAPRYKIVGIPID